MREKIIRMRGCTLVTERIQEALSPARNACVSKKHACDAGDSAFGTPSVAKVQLAPWLPNHPQVIGKSESLRVALVTERAQEALSPARDARFSKKHVSGAGESAFWNPSVAKVTLGASL